MAIQAVAYETIVALKIIASSDAEFRGSLQRIKWMIKPQDREYNDETKVWTIKNPETYREALPEIDRAIELRKAQGTLFSSGPDGRWIYEDEEPLQE
jgi:fructose-1-phosphate kinase PfkB-like protein